MADDTITVNPKPNNDMGGISGGTFNQNDPQPSATQENEDQYYNGNTYLPGTDDIDEAVFENLLKVGLHDIIYTTGPSKLRNEFPKFNEAINNKNWTEAAKESHRKDVGNGRNRDTMRQILTGNEG